MTDTTNLPGLSRDIAVDLFRARQHERERLEHEIAMAIPNGTAKCRRSIRKTCCSTAAGRSWWFPMPAGQPASASAW